MKRTTTMVLFASIFAVTVGTLGLGANSATLLMASAVPQSQEQMGLLGHVEYKVLDSSGNIVQYLQNDNVVVNDGEDCVASLVFGDGTCANTNAFNYIGIGNGSSGTVDATNSTLADSNDGDGIGTCASSGVGGDMARKQVTATHAAASGATGAVVTLDLSGSPFTFDASNATTVIDSGVFDDTYDTPGVQCAGTNTAGTTWDMFSRQLLTGDSTGITVTDGDSLSVKWTITVG